MPGPATIELSIIGLAAFACYAVKRMRARPTSGRSPPPKPTTEEPMPLTQTRRKRNRANRPCLGGQVQQGLGGADDPRATTTDHEPRPHTNRHSVQAN